MGRSRKENRYTRVSRTIYIRPRAEADILRAKEWYNKKKSGLGDEFISEIRRFIKTLEENPEKRAFYYRNFRCLFTRRFPYKIFYIVEADRVVVFRVLHIKADHPRWLESSKT
jgi:toxin ParE1/3/4